MTNLTLSFNKLTEVPKELHLNYNPALIGLEVKGRLVVSDDEEDIGFPGSASFKPVLMGKADTP